MEKQESKFLSVLKKTFKIDPSDFTWRSILVVVGTFMIGFVGLGIGNMAISQFVNPLAEHFGVGRSTITLYTTFTKIAGMITAIFFPEIYRKWGPKGLALFAGIPLALQFVIWSVATNLTMINIGSFIGGIGVQCAGGMMILAIIRPWFKKNVGIFGALCGTASGLGGSIFTMRIASRIAEQGWQSGARMVAILVAVLIFIPFFLVKANDKDTMYIKTAKKLEAEAQAATKEGEKKKAIAPPLSYWEYMKVPSTWICIVLMFLTAGTTLPFMKAMNGVAAWKGFDGAVVGAAAFAAYSFWLSWSKIGMGILRDLTGMKFCQIFAWGTNILSMAAMLFIPNMSPGMFKFLAAINCFAGTATQLGIGFMLIQSFGKYYNPRVYSLITIFFNIGRAIGEPLIQLPYDKWGTYAPTLWAMLIVGILMLVLSMIALNQGQKTIKKMDKIFTEKGYDISQLDEA